MMASPSELSLECKPHSYSMLLKSFGEKLTDQTQNLEEFLARLEEERLKIDAFKRELPLCMQLLTNAVEASRQQLQSYKEKNQGATRPVLEEFIPLKMNANAEGGEKVSNTTDNKANWMTSAQLWSPGSDQETKEKSTITKETDHMGFSKIAIDHHNKEIKNGGVGGGGFLPFTKDSHNNNSCLSPTVLALAPSSNNKQNHHEIMDHHHHHQDNKNLETVLNYSSGNKANNSSTPISSEQGGGKLLLGDSQSTAVATNSTTTTSGGGQQPHRKARRCWSPDLHRRFVNALQMLGGSQVATPKQIRELMKVDGLTNDEVKSHLQKYRLHTRRPSPSPQAAATAAPHLVVLGGIWVPPEYATAAHGGAPTAATLYGPHPTNHAPPQHYIAAPQAVGAHQEFYTPQPLQSLHGHLQHQQLYHHGSHMYNNNNCNNKPPASNSITHSQPESDVGGSGHGDRSESIEDGKSECSS